MKEMTRVGIFGGSFDPFHFGHLNSITTVMEKLGLDKVRVVPAAQSPMRVQTQGATSEQRAEMVRLGIAGAEGLELDLSEIKRGGVSYTIDTLKAMANDHEKLFLIIGLDQFQKFDQWKDFEKILDLADLIVTSRPNMELPFSVEDYPGGLRKLIDDCDRHQAMLKNGKTIHFIQLKDVEAAGTEIRRKLRLSQKVHDLIPLSVAEYVQSQHLYESVEKSIGDYEKFAGFCAGILNEKGGVNVKGFDLKDMSSPSEFTLVASGTSTRHTAALAEHLVREVKKQYGVWAESIEGQSEGRWVVVDYGALIVHIFYDFVRQEYRLEKLWKKGKPLSL